MRDIFEYNLKLSSIELDKREIEKFFGCDLSSEAESLIYQLNSIEAKGAFLIIDISESNFDFGAKVRSVFSKSEKVAIFVSTLGQESKKIIGLNKSDPFAYYSIDFLASQFADEMAGYMQERIEEFAQRNSYKSSNRYSPGYCGWNVNEQRKLFDFFPDNQCGIRLTDSFLMDPVKSVSGAIALGSDIVFQEYGCKICDDINCLYKSKL